MELKEARVIDSKSGLKVVLPMTQPTGKVRIKERSFFGDYGNPGRHQGKAARGWNTGDALCLHTDNDSGVSAECDRACARCKRMCRLVDWKRGGTFGARIVPRVRNAVAKAST